MEDEEKRRRYEGFEEKRLVKPVAALVFKKDKKGQEVEKDFDAEARAFCGGDGGAFGVKAEPLIASGSIFSPEAKKSFRSDAWQMEFGYRL